MSEQRGAQADEASSEGSAGGGTTGDEVEEAAAAWFGANWDPSLPLGEWWQRLADSGWGFPTWPRQWFGKGLGHGEARRVHAARAAAGAFGPPCGIATMMVVPTLIQLGTPAQQERYIPAIANGQELWCQLFSEPGAGSDMAGIQTRAVRDGDEWVVNGQKVWTSGGHYSRWAILLARTNPDVPKHRGLSFFLLDMRQAGVETRPLHQMNGHAEFNEVFLTDARVPQENMVGGEGDGWRVALDILSHERASMDADAGGGMLPAFDLRAPAGSFVGRGDEADDALAWASGAPARQLLGDLLERAGRRHDPAARQAVAGLTSLIEIARYAGGTMEPSAGKLAAVQLMRRMREISLALEGAHGTLSGGDAPLDGLVQEIALTVPSMSIAGGTDEIQRNIIGERVLGLAVEPRVDKDLPFRELRKG